MPVIGGNSLFKVIVKQTYLGQKCQNVFWYFKNVAPNSIDALDVANAFHDAVLSDWETLTHEDWDTDTIEVIEVTSLENFTEITSAIGPGVKTGNALASTIALGIKMVRTTRETRSGWKRLVGLAQSDLAENDWASGTQTQASSLADEFSADLSVAGTTIFPCLVRQTKDPDTKELLDPDEWIYNLVSTAIVKSEVTTQNSRKPGRGS